MLTRNAEIRKAKGDIPTWEIAERLGIHEQTFYLWMRKELPSDKKEQILSIIHEIKETKQESESVEVVKLHGGMPSVIKWKGRRFVYEPVR